MNRHSEPLAVKGKGAFCRLQGLVGLLSILPIKLPQFVPAFVLFCLGWIGILFVPKPEVEPVDIALVDRVPVLRLILFMAFVRVDEHFNRLL